MATKSSRNAAPTAIKATRAGELSSVAARVGVRTTLSAMPVPPASERLDEVDGQQDREGHLCAGAAVRRRERDRISGLGLPVGRKGLVDILVEFTLGS